MHLFLESIQVGRQTDQGGVVTKHESMGRRQLAYEILHKTEGNFVLLEIEGSGREIAELERRMRVNDRIIRYITVRVDEDRRRAEKFKAKRAKKAGAKIFRGGAFKPRTSPYDFQGMETEGLKLLAKAREATGLAINGRLNNGSTS